MGKYHILPHLVPTVPGQSGSPIIDITQPEDPQVVGIHVCCVEVAHSSSGNACERRNENYLQEAISASDLITLFREAHPISSLVPH